MKVYISGPITGHPDYMERFSEAEEKLKEQGHEVINPAKVNANLPASTTYDQHMTLDYIMLDMADAVCMLSGWDKSKGACIEYGYALAKGKIIINSYYGVKNVDNGSRKVTPEFGKKILETLNPKGIFWFEEGAIFIAVDNTQSEMFMEEFSDFENCQKWIRAEKCVDSNGNEHFD